MRGKSHARGRSNLPEAKEPVGERDRRAITIPAESPDLTAAVPRGTRIVEAEKGVSLKARPCAFCVWTVPRLD